MRIALEPSLAQNLRSEVISDPAAASRLQSQWHALLARSASNANGLSVTPEWLLTWWREFGGLDGRQFRLVAVRRGESLVGLAPLVRRRVWRFPGVPFRRLEFVATGERAGDSIHSDYLNVIAECGTEAEVARTLAGAIVRGELGAFDEVVLSMMAGDDPNCKLLAASFQEVGLSVEQHSLGEAPYVALPPTWDEYLKGLTAKGRWNAKNTLKVFDQWAAGSSRLDVVRDLADLDAGKRILVQLHHDRWQAGGTFHSPRFLRFHDAIMRWLLPSGGLELLTLHAHGEPIAALYNLVWNGKVW